VRSKETTLREEKQREKIHVAKGKVRGEKDSYMVKEKKINGGEGERVVRGYISVLAC
jgi:hypothetical protein